jgi:glycosyltransferase involved in cell wall biosynthesis
MMVGKPIIVSSCPPLSRIVREAHCGLVFKSGNSIEFAEQVVKLYNSQALQDKFIQNGINYTFKDKHTWQRESDKLINIYNSI